MMERWRRQARARGGLWGEGGYREGIQRLRPAAMLLALPARRARISELQVRAIVVLRALGGKVQEAVLPRAHVAAKIALSGPPSRLGEAPRLGGRLRGGLLRG